LIFNGKSRAVTALLLTSLLYRC